MNAQGTQPPTQQLLSDLANAHGLEMATLISLITERLPRAAKYQVTVVPGGIAANAQATAAVSVKGLNTTDVVIVNKPTRTDNLNVVQAWVSATNTLSLTFANTSSALITPPSEVYGVYAFRI